MTSLEIFLPEFINFLTKALPKLPVPPVIKYEFFLTLYFLCYCLLIYFKDNNSFITLNTLFFVNVGYIGNDISFL